ncbi:MAG: hypothetical protein GF330_08595 [Candidatus Eisenbacteria bacterium]|nr:hypothetical protein [Candidatus Eisenbacteria bacterium]
MKASQRRLQRLLQHLEPARRLLILTHDNPDPDALASGWVLRTIVRRRLGLRADLAHGGIIGRAENRALVRLLRIPLRRLGEIRLRAARYDAIALVDTQPAAGNNLLPAGRLPDVVIDHHPVRRATREVPFVDVRPGYGACASMLFEYLRAAGLLEDRRLATALFYAIRSETQNLGREATSGDRGAFQALFPRVDNRLIARIEQAPIARDYLALLNSAFEATRLYGSLSVTRLGRMPYPDVAAELADLLLRIDEVRWAFVSGIYRDRLYLSIRTSQRRRNAGRLLQRVVGDAGRAGGHGMMAGGSVPLDGPGDAPRVQRRIARRLREELGVGGQRGRPLLRGGS